MQLGEEGKVCKKVFIDVGNNVPHSMLSSRPRVTLTRTPIVSLSKRESVQGTSFGVAVCDDLVVTVLSCKFSWCPSVFLIADVSIYDRPKQFATRLFRIALTWMLSCFLYVRVFVGACMRWEQLSDPDFFF